MLESTTERNLPRVDPEPEELGPLPEPQTFYYSLSTNLWVSLATASNITL